MARLVLDVSTVWAEHTFALGNFSPGEFVSMVIHDNATPLTWESRGKLSSPSALADEASPILIAHVPVPVPISNILRGLSNGAKYSRSPSKLLKIQC